jgi:hypothetical protein
MPRSAPYDPKSNEYPKRVYPGGYKKGTPGVTVTSKDEEDKVLAVPAKEPEKPAVVKPKIVEAAKPQAN